MEKLALLLLALLLSTPVHASQVNFDHLTQGKKATAAAVAQNALWGAAVMSLYADWATTRDMGKYYDTPNPKNGKSYREKGMLGLFGDRPSAGEVNAYFATLLGLNITVNMFQTFHKSRGFVNIVQTSVHLNAAKRNMEIGLSAGF